MSAPRELNPSLKRMLCLAKLEILQKPNKQRCKIIVMTDWNKQENMGRKGCFMHPPVVEEIDGCKSKCLDEKLRPCTISLSQYVISFLYLATFLMAWRGHNSV